MYSLDSRTLIEDAVQELVLEKKIVCITQDENERMALPWIVELERRLADVLADSVLNSPHLARLQVLPEDMVATLMHTGPDVPAKRSLLPASMTTSRRPSSWPCGTASAAFQGVWSWAELYCVESLDSLAALLTICRAWKLDVQLAAPTGKAAKRREEMKH